MVSSLWFIVAMVSSLQPTVPKLHSNDQTVCKNLFTIIFFCRGIILFAMLNGRLPYNDRDIRTLIEQTKSKPRFSSRINVTPGMRYVNIREIKITRFFVHSIVHFNLCLNRKIFKYKKKITVFIFIYFPLECQDLVCKILTTDIQDRATLEEIARHPWLTADETAEEVSIFIFRASSFFASLFLVYRYS